MSEKKERTGHFSSKSDKWNTPKFLVERIHKFFGGIELDPATSPNNPTGAQRFYTPEDDGLSQPWVAQRLYLNPPYGRTMKRWMRKLTDEVNAGNVKEALCLVAARVDTAWWEIISDRPVIFVRGRLHFNDSEHGAFFPSALVYFGPYWWDFEAKFSDLGQLYLPSQFAKKVFE